MPLPEPNFNIRRTNRDGPESEIVEKIYKKLTLMDWFVKVMHGNIFQSGFPDLFCCHKDYGIRLVEVKNEKNFSFTAAQLELFPKLQAHGCGVWILVNDSDTEIRKLFTEPNWFYYLPIMRGRAIK